MCCYWETTARCAGRAGALRKRWEYSLKRSDCRRAVSPASAQDSRGCVGAADHTQENIWPSRIASGGPDDAKSVQQYWSDVMVMVTHSVCKLYKALSRYLKGLNDKSWHGAWQLCLRSMLLKTPPVQRSASGDGRPWLRRGAGARNCFWL